MLSSRKATRLLALLATLLVVVLATVAAAWHPLLRPALYARVGEEDTAQLLTGIAGYLYLRIIHGTPDLAPYVPMPHMDHSPLGVHTFLEQEVEPEKVAHSLDLIRAAGFRFVRQQFPWEDIEISAKGDFWDHRWNQCAWAKYDRIVDKAVERDLQLVVRLDNPPGWSRTGGEGESYKNTFAPPDRLTDFGDFVEAVVTRYRGRVRYYQIWNEPNIFPEWGDRPVDAAAYTRLLQEAYRRAKAADPNAVIISAPLAPTLERGPRNLSDLIFLQQMYDAGAGDYFDILAVNAYGLWTGPTDRRLAPDRTNFSRPQLIREIMVRNGDAGNPIWAMEIGWNAIPEGHPAPPKFGRVSREAQARHAVAAYERAQRDWPWMGVMSYWFFKRATDLERDQPFYYFALFEPDFTPWPAYHAIKEYARDAAVLYPGYRQESHWALEYDGPWQQQQDASAVLGGYRQGAAGARLRFRFWGSELDLVPHGPAAPGDLRVTVDGRSAHLSASRFDGRAVLAVVRRPSPALHMVEVEVSNEGGFRLDGLVVRRTDRRALYVLVAILTASATGCLLWFAISRWRSRGR